MVVELSEFAACEGESPAPQEAVGVNPWHPARSGAALKPRLATICVTRELTLDPIARDMSRPEAKSASCNLFFRVSPGLFEFPWRRIKNKRLRRKAWRSKRRRASDENAPQTQEDLGRDDGIDKEATEPPMSNNPENDAADTKDELQD